MTTRAIEQAEAHLEAYELRQISARAYTAEVDRAATVERLFRASEAESRSAMGAIVWLVLGLVLGLPAVVLGWWVISRMPAWAPWAVLAAMLGAGVVMTRRRR